MDGYPQQFSNPTREALETSVDELVDAVRRHAAHLLSVRGATSEMNGLMAANDDVARAVEAWSNRVFDHSGTFPVFVEVEDDDDDDSLLDDFESDLESAPAPLPTGAPLSVVSRWDLEVEDVDALIRSGREAHLRQWPHDSPQDAEVAVPDVSQALHCVLQEAAEPWYTLPGIAVVRGQRALVLAAERAGRLLPEEDMDEVIVEPPGERLATEVWC